MWKKTSNDLRRLLDLRRSNASQPLRNKKKYSRKVKHKKIDNSE
jgi:hypothetical protein